LFKGDYVDERIEVSEETLAPALPDANRLGARLLRTKFRHWSYESEQRIFYRLTEPLVVNDSGKYFAPLGGVVLLKEVILGALYEPNNDGSLKDMLIANKVRIGTARPAFKTFRMVPQEKPSLRKAI
jgi:hypothetical protein